MIANKRGVKGALFTTWYYEYMKSIVVAYEQNRIIGAGNSLPWQGKLPADMKHFRELTLNTTVIMGRRTYESIGRPLPHRQNVVVTRIANLAIPQVVVVGSLPEAFAAADNDAVVIGGGDIYRQALPYVDRVYATEINAHLEGDVTFPVLDSSWQEIAREEHMRDDKNAFDYGFVTYDKRPVS